MGDNLENSQSIAGSGYSYVKPSGPSKKYLSVNIREKSFPIYLIGDSHVLSSSGLLIQETLTDHNYLVISKYISGLCPNGMMEGESLSRQMLSALESEHLVRNGRFTFSSLERQDISVSFATGISAMPPLVALTTGDIQMRGTILSMLRNQYEFMLPYESPYDKAAPGAKIVPYATLKQKVLEILLPLGLAIITMQRMGLPKVIVIAYPPPTIDDKLFESINGFSCPRDTRYKTTCLFNEVLKDICDSVGAVLINTWSELVDDNGYLLPEYEFDGTHLSQSGMLTALREIIQTGIDESTRRLNVGRYELAYSLRDVGSFLPLTPESQASSKQFHDTCICTVNVDPVVTDKILSLLHFDRDVGNRHVRIDWPGGGFEPFSGAIKTGDLDQAALDAIYDMMYSPEVLSVVQQCLGGDPWYLCRPVHSVLHSETPFGPQAFHGDGCPPHIIRAICYLVDVDGQNGPTEYYGLDKVLRQVHGPRGTMSIFNADRLVHRGAPPISQDRKALDFVIFPRMPSQQRRVMFQGWNHWPADPFIFSVNGMCSSPALESPVLVTNPFTG